MTRRGERTKARIRAWKFGRMAEALCAATLRARGYRILARGFRSPLGEIDIVAARGRTLAFIEVKARTDARAEMMTVRQRGRIVRAASAFLAMRPNLVDRDVRFDLMEVVPWRWPRHHPDAWRPDDAEFRTGHRRSFP